MRLHVYVCTKSDCVKYGVEEKYNADSFEPAYYGPLVQDRVTKQEKRCPFCGLPLRFLREEIATEAQTIGTGAIVGGIIGAIVGGPGGAVVGSMIGSIIGKASYEKEKQQQFWGGQP